MRQAFWGAFGQSCDKKVSQNSAVGNNTGFDPSFLAVNLVYAAESGANGQKITDQPTSIGRKPLMSKESNLNGTEPTDSSGEEAMVFIILGEVRRQDEKEMLPFNALLAAADDDSAVRQCLEALAQEGYEEADLHQIGNLEGRPEEDPFTSAYDAALEGEVAIIAYEQGYDFSGSSSSH